ITSRQPSASASSRSTRRCIRSVSASRGRCTPGRSTSTSCQSAPVATPRIARRVVWGLSETIATLAPTMALASVDLPTFGLPASATKPERVEPVTGAQPRAQCALGHPAHQLGLQGEHLTVVGLVVHAADMQRAVDDRLAQILGVAGADHDVAELARADAGAVLVAPEREHVGRLLAAGIPVELADPLLVDKLDRQMPLLDPRRGQRQRAEFLDLDRGRALDGRGIDPDHLDVEHASLRPRARGPLGRPLVVGAPLIWAAAAPSGWAGGAGRRR